MRHLLWLVVLGLGCLLVSGCEIEKWARSDDKGASAEDKDDSQPHYVISVNEIVKYPRAEQLEREVATYDGRTIWVNTNPYLHSRNIETIELVPDPDQKGFYHLKCKLNRRGKMLWMQMAAQFANRQMAFLVDGVFYRAFTPQPLQNEEVGTVIIDGPFDVYTAKTLQKYAPANYKIFSPDDDKDAGKK